jgi:predicted DNA-binding transcriptional regulator AlpA
VNPNKKYNKTFFDRVGRGVKIGSYNARWLSSELKQFLKDNPQYKDNSLIKSLVALKDKK